MRVYVLRKLNEAFFMMAIVSVMLLFLALLFVCTSFQEQYPQIPYIVPFICVLSLLGFFFCLRFLFMIVPKYQLGLDDKELTISNDGLIADRADLSQIALIKYTKSRFGENRLMMGEEVKIYTDSGNLLFKANSTGQRDEFVSFVNEMCESVCPELHSSREYKGAVFIDYINPRADQSYVAKKYESKKIERRYIPLFITAVAFSILVIALIILHFFGK